MLVYIKIERNKKSDKLRKNKNQLQAHRNIYIYIYNFLKIFIRIIQRMENTYRVIIPET